MLSLYVCNAQIIDSLVLSYYVVCSFITNKQTNNKINNHMYQFLKMMNENAQVLFNVIWGLNKQ